MSTRLSPLVRLVRADNPSPYTLEGTNTYLVGNRSPIVIDPGPDDDAHLARVLEESGLPSVVLLTHMHPDHSEGARRFAEMAGSPLAAFDGSDGRVPLSDGERMTAGDATLVAVSTPGHSRDHCSFWLEEERALFSGDHVLGRGTSVVAFPDGDMADYMASLERVIALEPVRIYPGHGPVIDEPEGVLAYYRSHRVEREGEVLAAIEAGLGTVPEMVERIYAAYPKELHPAAALSVSAHLEKLAREGRAAERDGAWRRT